MFVLVLECISFCMKAMLVSRPAWRINITPHLFCQRYGQVKVSVSVLGWKGGRLRGSCPCLLDTQFVPASPPWEHFPGLRSCWWICPVCFPVCPWGNKISGFGFTTLFSHLLCTSHDRAVQTDKTFLVQGRPEVQVGDCWIWQLRISCAVSRGCAVPYKGLGYFFFNLFSQNARYSNPVFLSLARLWMTPCCPWLPAV